MNTAKNGVMVARAAGLVLIITGVSSLLVFIPWFQPSSSAQSGWTGYSPGEAAAPESPTMFFHESHFIIPGPMSVHYPVTAQFLAGVAMIVFSKPLGRLLARGLDEKDIASIT